jgi:REP element-mobilizing transposase RayT
LLDEGQKSNRLRDYDYSQSGYYFVTICTEKRKEWFGEVEEEKMHLNTFGEIAADYWKGIPAHFPNLEMDEFTVMPNHIHGITIIQYGFSVGNAYMRSLQHSLQGRTKMLLSKVIQQYKAAVTRRINSSLRRDFAWQKSFYDHVIRNEKSLDSLGQYIRNNPSNGN